LVESVVAVVGRGWVVMVQHQQMDLLFPSKALVALEQIHISVLL
jgi:hypothetical protein